MRESMVTAILGAQLTVGGALLHLAESGPGQVDENGGPMIFFGVVFGLLAAVRSHRVDRVAADQQ